MRVSPGPSDRLLRRRASAAGMVTRPGQTCSRCRATSMVGPCRRTKRSVCYAGFQSLLEQPPARQTIKARRPAQCWSSGLTRTRAVTGQ
jgi:hypothetical protein